MTCSQSTWAYLVAGTLGFTLAVLPGALHVLISIVLGNNQQLTPHLKPFATRYERVELAGGRRVTPEVVLLAVQLELQLLLLVVAGSGRRRHERRR